MTQLTKRDVKTAVEKTLISNEAGLIKTTAEMAKQLRAIAADMDAVSKAISNQLRAGTPEAKASIAPKRK